MAVQRSIAETLIDYLALFPATGIVGPRQVGKTTLARQIASEMPSTYLDLENQNDRDKLEDPTHYLNQFSHQMVILDEIQFMPQLFQSLRGIIDADRRPGRFILLGSASPEIIKGSAETLAGRIGYLQLTPFILSEVNTILPLWLRGGFPISFLANTDRASSIWRKNFVQTYIQRDLGLLGLNTNPLLMEKLWRMLAVQHGQLLNAEALARALDISRPTVQRFLDFLEGAFIIRQLRPWYRNLTKRLVKAPKIYLRDSGLLHLLAGIETYEAILNHPQVGASWEGFVIEQIINAAGDAYTPWFYRTHQGAECDLLIEKNGKILAAIEIKHGTNPKASKGFYVSMHDTAAEAGFLIGTGTESFTTNEKLTVTNLPHFINIYLPRL
jgi:hypothetical protein